jgi:hypothetical protein
MNPRCTLRKIVRRLHRYLFNSVPNHAHEIDLTKLAPIYLRLEPSASRTFRDGGLRHHRQVA